MAMSVDTSGSLEGPVPFDAHYHARFDEYVNDTIPPIAAQFSDVLIMPNRAKGGHLIEVSEVLAYREQILRAAPANDFEFRPIMTVSLTHEMTREKLEAALDCEHIYAVKLYAGHTTNAAGVADLSVFDWAFDMIEESGKLLLVHGETDSTNPWNREREFYAARPMSPANRLRRVFPQLKIVAEHISTIEAAEWVKSHKNAWATITAHHLLVDISSMAGGGFKIHYWCKPPVQMLEDRQALLEAATSGNPKFFLGTDSAPHTKEAKYHLMGGSAGCFTALSAMELYATAFASVGRLDRLFDFASKFGRDVYGLSMPKGRLMLARSEPWEPEDHPFGNSTVIPFRLSEKEGDRTLVWKASRVA